MVKNPLHCLAVIGAIRRDGWLRGRRAGWLAACLFTVFCCLFLPARLSILRITIPGCLSTVSRPLLTIVGHLGLTAIGRPAAWLLLLTGNLFALVTVAWIAGRLPCPALGLRLTRRLPLLALCVSGLFAFPRLTGLRLLLTRPRLLLSRLRPLSALPLLRACRAAGILHARFAALLAGLLLVIGLTRLIVIRGVAVRLLAGILTRWLGLGIGRSSRFSPGRRPLLLVPTALFLRLSFRPLRLGVGRRWGQFVDDELPPGCGHSVWLRLPVVEHHRPILKHPCTGCILGWHHPGAHPQATAGPGIGSRRLGLPEHPLPHFPAPLRPGLNPNRRQRVVRIDRPHPNPHRSSGRNPQFIILGMVNRHFGRKIRQHLNPMGEWLGNDGDRPSILFRPGTKPQSIRGVL
jgi:hypothetical protein